jgi:ketosteroid isomerase-like protein
MSRTPREVFELLSAGITAGRWDELGALYAEDTVVEHPQNPAGPSRLDGRSAVAARFAGQAGSALNMRAHNIVVHETLDPEVIVAEYDYTVTHAGRSVEAANIQVLRVRDGLIRESRDYHDHFRIAAARNALGGLVATATGRRADGVPAPGRPAGSPAAPPESPRGVLERLVHGMSGGQRGELAELYADDAHVTHPFHPTAPPLKGRGELRAHFDSIPFGMRIEAYDLVLHETIDPEVVVGEFQYRGVAPFPMWNIFVVTVRDGLIVNSRDYGDHVTFLTATGKLEEVANTYEYGF